MSILNAVQEHYTDKGLTEFLTSALIDAGFGEGPIPWKRLSQIDQFHFRGLDATQELAEAMGVEGGEKFLDVGSGFGGPARFLAGQYGCLVTGIDLTPDYIEIAKTLARKTKLEEQLTFIQGDALHLPFPEDSFDFAWTMHVGMNISDKESLYREIHRVVKPGGKLGIYDILRTASESPIYPLPWAAHPETSFLATPEEMRDYLKKGGFRSVESEDKTRPLFEWLAGIKAREATNDTKTIGTANFNLVGKVFRDDATQINNNIARNISEGRIRIEQFIATKAGGRS